MTVLVLLGVLGVLGVHVAPNARAQENNPTKASTAVYTRVDTDSTTIITPSVSVAAQLTDQTRVGVDYLVDVWTSASIDIVTAASKRVTEQRDEIDVSVDQEFKDLALGASYRYSTEYDYESHGGSLGASYDFADNNATLATVARAAFDDVWAAGGDRFKKPASTLSLRTSFTQVLDTQMLAQVVYEVGRQEGFLSSPYRYVRIADDLGTVPSTCQFPVDMCLLESNPDSRMKHALALKLRRALGKAFSAGLGYRFYFDSWEMRSHTIDADLAWMPTERWIVALAYRFYVQGKAFHFESFYPSKNLPAFYTSDKELSSMSSHRIGFELSRAWALDDVGSKLNTVLLMAPTFYQYSDFIRLKSITAFETTLSVGVEL